MKKSKKIIAIISFIIPILLISEFQNLNKGTSKSIFSPMRQLDLKNKKEEVCRKVSDDFYYNYTIEHNDIILYYIKDNETKVSNLIDMIENNSFTKNKFFHEYILKLDSFRGFLFLFSICCLTTIISFSLFFGCFCIINTECSQACCYSVTNCCCNRLSPRKRVRYCCFSIIFLFSIPLIILPFIIKKYSQKEIMLSDVECSLIKLIEDIYEGEGKSEINITKWPGVEVAQQKLYDIANIIENISQENRTLTELEKSYNTINQKREIFEKEFILRSENINNDNNYYFNYNSWDYELDLAKEFVIYNNYLSFSPDNTIIKRWYEEYNNQDNNVNNNINRGFYFLERLNSTDNKNSLYKASNNLLRMKESLLFLKNEIYGIVMDNLININKKILLGLNITQISSLSFTVIFIIYWILMIIFFEKVYEDDEEKIKMIKTFTYIFYVLSIILSILTFLMMFVGYTLWIVGNTGKDFYKAISYLLNFTNYNQTIFGNSSEIIDICINGNGDISGRIDLSYENLYIFDEIKEIEKNLLEIETNIINNKNNTSTYNKYKDLLYSRANYEDIDFGIVRGNEKIILKNLLQELNEKTSFINEEWNFTYTDSISCSPYIAHSNKLYFNPKTCDPFIRYGSISDLEEVSKYISEIMRMQDYANGDNNNSIKTVIDDLNEKYLDYLEEILKGVRLYINDIYNITNITKDIIGENNNFFSFLNCSIIGIDTKIILKILRINIGEIFPKLSEAMIFADLIFILNLCFVLYIFSPIRLYLKIYEYQQNLRKLIILGLLLDLIS